MLLKNEGWKGLTGHGSGMSQRFRFAREQKYTSTCHSHARPLRTGDHRELCGVPAP